MAAPSFLSSIAATDVLLAIPIQQAGGANARAAELRHLGSFELGQKPAPQKLHGAHESKSGSTTMQTRQIPRRPERNVAAPARTPAQTIVPEAQVESFVYRSREAAAETRAEPAVRQELHGAIHTVYVLCWVALFGIFALTFAGSPYALYMVGVAVLSSSSLFIVPALIMRAGRKAALTPAEAQGSIGEFLRGEFATLTGPLNGVEALIQVLLVPVCLTIGAVAISFIIQASKTAY
jgi:hypothetical protein